MTQQAGERIYPWGNQRPDCNLANFIYCMGGTSPVGSYPAGAISAEGDSVYDFAGNVEEWCNDWHICDLGTIPVTNPPGPLSGSDRLYRGGSWWDNGFILSSARRSNTWPSLKSSRLGFRCARSH